MENSLNYSEYSDEQILALIEQAHQLSVEAQADLRSEILQRESIPAERIRDLGRHIRHHQKLKYDAILQESRAYSIKNMTSFMAIYFFANILVIAAAILIQWDGYIGIPFIAIILSLIVLPFLTANRGVIRVHEDHFEVKDYTELDPYMAKGFYWQVEHFLNIMLTLLGIHKYLWYNYEDIQEIDRSTGIILYKVMHDAPPAGSDAATLDTEAIVERDPHHTRSTKSLIYLVNHKSELIDVLTYKGVYVS